MAARQSIAQANPERAPVLVKPNEKAKALKSTEQSGIQLTVDVEKQHIVLPKQQYAADPDLFMRKELPFFRECLQAAFGRVLISLRLLYCEWLTSPHSTGV